MYKSPSLLRVLITSGPTRETIDPVRYLSNYSSGKQGHAIASAFAKIGADVVLVSGPVNLSDPKDVTTVHVNSAQEMLAACEQALPVDIAICAAAVADWRPTHVAKHKLKKQEGEETLTITCVRNPDILHTLSTHPFKRPSLVIGFAAETEHLENYAKEKRKKKQCDAILANDVSKGIFGAEDNHILFITEEISEYWEPMSKEKVAEKLTGWCLNHPVFK